MRTTLNIDDDVLAAAKELASMQRTSVGRALSVLARSAMTRAPGGSSVHGDEAGEATGPPIDRHPFRPFASRGVQVSLADVECLLDEDRA
jgi:hypothetical protein